MSSIQERLQLKRVPLDSWSVREQLCLASAVVRSGDQNWMSVSRALKTVGEPNRPADWYSQKSCAAQYGALLEHVETPKRKKRSSEGAVETPQESILKRLTQDRIAEIQKTITEMNQQYEQLNEEITEVRNTSTSEERLKEIWNNIEAARRLRERENARRAALLKEREERRARAERGWRPSQPTTPTSPAAPAPPSSPLLTSLLKSSPVVTTPQHIPHPANVVDTMSPSVTAPTLSMLLEKTAASAQHESKHAAIEHIKSQLVQIEHQLKASSAPAPAAPASAPSVDIDDIEIKEEDVYAFRDIDIHIPPVQTMHKGTTRLPEKSTAKDDTEEAAPSDTAPEPVPEEVVKEEPMAVDEDEVLTAEIETTPEESPVEEPPELVASPAAEVKVVFPEVKFPTTEIKVIQPDEKKIKEEVKEPEPPAPEVEQRDDVIAEEETPPVVEEEISVVQPEPPPPEDPPAVTEEPQEEEVVAPDPQSIPLPPEPQEEPPQVVEEPPPPPTEVEVTPQDPPAEEKQEEKEIEVEQSETVVQDVEEDVKKVEDAEDSIPLKEMIKEDPGHERAAEETHTETDDDTPMELSREEEKDGKKRRDYSRKKKSDSRTCSGSESAAEASAPDSPSGGDDRQHRLWKKSVMLVYSRLCGHKYASVFARPISDEEAPGYSLVVKRPMDMNTIRRHIDSGHIRTTAQFQRDVLLMLSNALMYNSSEHSVYTMAREMHEEAQCQLGMLVAAQAHAGLLAPRRKRRRPHDHTHHHKRMH